jgi:predicted enzyme related to lactoylglutathione lyase
VSSNGGKVTKEKFALGKYGFSALITDTEGNVVGLHSMQ